MVRVSSAAVFLLLALNAAAQTPPTKATPAPDTSTPALAVKQIPNHNGGLVTYYSGNRLKDDEAQVATNVFFDRDSGVVKRSGQAIFQNIAGCTAQVRASGQLNAPSGVQYFFEVCGGQTYESTGGVFSTIGGTISATAGVYMVQGLGQEWITDGVDVLWSTDGVNISSYPTAPLATLDGVFQSRIVLANVSGGKSTIYLSGYDNGGDYTLPAVIVDTTAAIFGLNGLNDGRNVTCVSSSYRDVQILWNRDEMYGLYGSGNSTFILRKLAEIGCDEQETVQEFDGKLRWLSKYGLYQWDGTSAMRISDNVKDQIENIITTEPGYLSITQDQQGNWQAGNLDVSGLGAPLSATIDPGNVVGTTFTVTDALANPNATVNIDSVTTPGVLTLSSTTTNEVWTNGTLQGNYGWTQPAGVFLWESAASCAGAGNNCIIADPAPALGIGGLGNQTQTTQIALSSGVWNFTHFWTTAGPDCGASGLCFEYRFDYVDASHYYAAYMNTNGGSNNHIVGLSYRNGGGITYLTAEPYYTPASTPLNWSVIRNSNGAMFLSISGVQIASAPAVNLISPGTTLMIAASGESGFFGNAFTNINSYQYNSPGKWLSQEFNTGLSTPTWGLFSSTFSVADQNVQNQVIFYTQVSTSPNNDLYDAKVAASDTVHIASAQKQYIRYEADFAIYNSTTPPSVSSVTMTADTTGYMITSCFNTAPNIGWGLLQATALQADGAVDFWVSTGTTCDGVQRATDTWTAQTPNTTIGVATAPYLGVRVLLTGSPYFNPDNQPTLQSITINWQSIAGRPHSVTQVFDNRYWLAYTTVTTGAAFNNQVLVYDSEGHWSQFQGINASSLVTYQRLLYSGSSLGDGNVLVQNTGDTDLGSNILFDFKTPDYELDAFNTVDLYDLNLEFNAVSPAYTPAITVQYFADGDTNAYSLGTVPLTAGTKGLIYSNARFGASSASPVKVHTVSFEILDNTATPLTFYRSMLRYTPEDGP